VAKIGGIDISDARIAEHLKTMRSRWSEGFRNPHGGACEPSWVVSYTPKVRSGPLPPPLPPKANATLATHSNRASTPGGRTPASAKSGKPGALVQNAPGSGRCGRHGSSGARQGRGRKKARPDEYVSACSAARKSIVRKSGQ
jgi:hypothetical protein